MSRKAARGQKLPPQEVEYLNSLTLDALIVRVNALYSVGWPLQAIGEALSPKRPRTTIRSWVVRAAETSQVNLIDAPIVPTPRQREATSGPKKASSEIPEISADALYEIKVLAPLARGYRSRMASTSAAAVANSRLTDICMKLHNDGVGVTELAKAAGVTYRAMYKRIKL